MKEHLLMSFVSLKHEHRTHDAVLAAWLALNEISQISSVNQWIITKPVIHIDELHVYNDWSWAWVLSNL